MSLLTFQSNTSLFSEILALFGRASTNPPKDDQLISPLFLALSALFAVICWTWMVSYLKTPKGRTPSGPLGLPIVGNLPFMDSQLHTYFASLAQAYGPVFKLKLGSKVGFVISSPSGAREVLKDHDTTFANRDVHKAALVVTYGGLDIVSAPYGPTWRMLRRVCVLKMLSRPTLDSVYGLRRREVREIITYLYGRAGSPMNVGEQMFLTVYNVITSMLWGRTVEGEDRARLGAELKNAVSELTELVARPNISDFYPFLNRFDLQGIHKRMKHVARRFDQVFETVIKQRLRIEKESGDRTAGPEGGVKERDFLQFLLELKDEEDSKTPLTFIGIKALLFNMIVNGTETSSNTVEFILAEMLNKPHILQKAQEELDSVVGKDKIVEESHTGKLHYIQAVVKESLRLHPPAPLLVPHCPSEDSTISGFRIPKGSRVYINIWATHRDPALWENPNEFDPERFVGRPEMDYKGTDFSYLPFGSGKRMCAGMAMAERMVMYSLATLLHSFNWELPPGEKLDLSEKFGIVMKKKVPLMAIPTPRLSDPALYK